MPQITQFACGVVLGSYYWLMHLRAPALFRSAGGWPTLSFKRGCDGGDELIVLCGFFANAALLLLFCRFTTRCIPRSKIYSESCCVASSRTSHYSSSSAIQTILLDFK